METIIIVIGLGIIIWSGGMWWCLAPSRKFWREQNKRWKEEK